MNGGQVLERRARASSWGLDPFDRKGAFPAVRHHQVDPGLLVDMLDSHCCKPHRAGAGGDRGVVAGHSLQGCVIIKKMFAFLY